MREWVPRGQKTARRFFVPEHTPHCLRHTWATWHYCAHKDLLKLQADGDWSEIKTVTGYAKLMPDTYRDEIIRWWSHGPDIHDPLSKMLHGFSTDQGDFLRIMADAGGFSRRNEKPRNRAINGGFPGASDRSKWWAQQGLNL
ncbi:hypothetical protein [Novacetimonas pomaceti]|uniref:hypothetical protein n=1 Tax=Novacetimonas pomaceti TaxID=2021998 RepID=UPI001C2D5C8C|nr:hypothetical protein [Novacetimonas pomaceti]MBV1833102.1 hypothetical protein [Novacetimonas pomaceti]